MKNDFRENDLYNPVKTLFENNGYVVQAEVNNCDVMCVKDSQIIVIELKKEFNLKLVYQAIERQNITNSVFVCITRPKNCKRDTLWKNMTNLLKRLNLGLILVSMDSDLKKAEIIFEPKEMKVKKNKKAQKALNEFSSRSGHYNSGGVNKTKIITSYREKSIKLACTLENKTYLSLKELKQLGFDEKVGRILNDNYYGWFEKVKRGYYCLSNKGKEMILSNEFKEIVDFYKNNKII